MELNQIEGYVGSPKDDPQTRSTVYVWDLAVRLTHWINVLCILILSLTGFFIHAPVADVHGEAVNNFLMGYVRLIHFTTAFVFSANVLFRIYWSFAGSKYARWQQFVPTTRTRLIRLRKMGAYYTFLRREPPPQVGHNPLAGLAYTGVHVLFVIQIMTGFALYSLSFSSGSIWPTLFGWLNALMGATGVRLLHDVVTWLIIAFTVHHVYSAILIEIEERSGLLGSIVTGYKSLTATHIYVAESQEPARLSKRLRSGRGSAKSGQGK